MSRFDVTVVGSANLDLVATAQRIPSPGETVLGTRYAEHPGGKGLNQAVASARSGAHTAFIGAVADDPAGQRLTEVLDEAGIDHTALAVIEHAASGRAMITVDAEGENTIVVLPGANHLLSPREDLEPTTVVLAQLEIPVAVVERALRLGRDQGATTVLNPAPATRLDRSLLALCDVVVPNEHEVDLLGGVDHLLQSGVAVVIVTRGAGGVDVHTTSGIHHQRAFPVTPVDTTGAGDSFCGAFAARLATGAAVTDAVRWGAAAGALAATVPGAVPSLPTAEAIETLLADGATA